MATQYFLFTCSDTPVVDSTGTVTSCTGSAAPAPLLAISDVEPIVVIIMGLLAVAYTFRLLGRLIMSMSDDY
ncbi:MAG: hypothetical protein ACYC0M_10225 [Burkholderiales bacterium]